MILHQLGIETSSLIQAFENLREPAVAWRALNPSRYPPLAERRTLAREVAAWITGRSRKDAPGPNGHGRRA